MATTFWLVLVLATGAGPDSNMLHVGNFSGKDQCQAAGRGLVGTAASHISYICVQANEVGKQPPP
jgi:hypothetical protein